MKPPLTICPSIQAWSPSARGYSAVKSINTLIADMEKALKSEYLAGPKYSLADCAVTPYANRLFDLGLLNCGQASATRSPVV